MYAIISILVTQKKLNMSGLVLNMTKYSKFEQMADEMLTTKLFLGSLRASRAIKK